MIDSCSMGKNILGAIRRAIGPLVPVLLVFLFCHSLNGQRSHQNRAGQGRDSIHPSGNKTEGFPNILLILLDDLGYGDLSIMVARDMHTPHIDALAKDGLSFASFYANSPVCSPSRVPLLTGQYPVRVGVPGVIRQNSDNSYGSLKAAVPMVSSTLRHAGFETAWIGKCHLGLETPNTPNARGFDFFKGFLGDMMDDHYTHLRVVSIGCDLTMHPYTPKDILPIFLRIGPWITLPTTMMASLSFPICPTTPLILPYSLPRPIWKRFWNGRNMA